MSIWIGVDPGQKGGVSILIPNREPVVKIWNNEDFIHDMRDVHTLIERTALSGENWSAIAAVEKVGAMPKQGLSSTFSFGKSAGFIEGVLAALSIPYQLIPPREWKKLFGLNSDKQKSIDVCKHLYPDVCLLPNERCRKESDGMAESLLLATYAKRKL